jgi:poly(A) polymerase
MLTEPMSARRSLALALLLVAVWACSRSSGGEGPAPPSATRSSREPGKATRPLTLVTYNVLATPIYQTLRAKAVLSILKRTDADIIALQEVTPWFLAHLVSANWVKARYHLTERNGDPFAPGGQLVLSKTPLSSIKATVLPGRQHRVLLVAELEIGSRTLAVATTHMESYLEDGPTRALQLDTMFAAVLGADDAIVLGDLNFGDGAEPETSRLDPAYVDAWAKLRPSDEGYTWNMPDNPLAEIGAFAGEPNRRLDRILVRSAAWRPKTIAIIGNATVARRELSPEQRRMVQMPERRSTNPETTTIDVFPSDHYGLTATLVPATDSPDG